ncbi:MAG: molybdopterin-guanine dinucleotide biosynthesis protein MobB [Synergistaceae bacterium]|jgi:molybdopterin-guanine dinucleotide biosynthesis protein B|nr:molybdopterin-guanine dinucleotide biosynthesis protein MobB [Synergistaceae bacterium]
MIIIAVSGYKNSGKSTLCRTLISSLQNLGFAVGYIKRTHEPVASPAWTDSGSVNEMGVPSLLWGYDSLRFETPCEPGAELPVSEIAGVYFPNADIVMVEGGKNLKLPKIWVLDEGGHPPDDGGIFAVYDRHGPGDGGLVYGADDAEDLASKIALLAERDARDARVYMDGRELPMKNFVASFLAGGVRGMLGALKNPSEGDVSGEIRVYLKKSGGHS